MDSSDLGRLVYLIILGAMVGGYFLAQSRENLSKTAQQALVWVLIFVGVIAGAGLWSDIRDDIAPRQSSIGGGVIEVPNSIDGHYYLVLEIDGHPIEFVVDTGASDIVLSQEDARDVGIDPNSLDYSGIAYTANGSVRTARVSNLRLGDIVDQDVTVLVNQGDLSGSLLGMSYLQRFEKIEISHGKLILTR